MKAPDHCRKCNQVIISLSLSNEQSVLFALQLKCQGKRVEVVVFAPGTEPKGPKKSAKGKGSAGKKAKKKR